MALTCIGCGSNTDPKTKSPEVINPLLLYHQSCLPCYCCKKKSNDEYGNVHIVPVSYPAFPDSKVSVLMLVGFHDNCLEQLKKK